MNYIQRLFDSTAPAALANLPVAPALAETSPLIAADQRLGLFPGLIDPFTAAPTMDGADPPPNVARAADVPAPQVSRSPERSPAPPLAPTPLANERGRDGAPPPSTAAPLARDTTPSLVPQRRAEPPAVSPLQRLAESAPLPPRTTPRQAETAPQPAPLPRADAARPTATPADPRAPQPAEVRQHANRSAAPAAPLPPPAIPNPASITPDQFTPTRDSANPPPRSTEPQPQPPAAQPAPMPAPRTPEPLAPATDTAPSPLARRPDLPPPATPHAEPRAEPETRIIESIREVQVARPAPPKPMTAAAQSVIGSLSGRSRWRSRMGRI